LDLTAAVTEARGIAWVPGGTSGANVEAAIRGLKSQSLKTALNCGCVL
jgi:hypothetical protein